MEKSFKAKIAELIDSPDNNIGVEAFVGEMTVEEAIELLNKNKTDVSGKEYLRTVTVVRDPKNPSLLHLNMTEAAN